MRAARVLVLLSIYLVVCYAGSALPNHWSTCSGDDSVKTSETEIVGEVSTNPYVKKSGRGGIFYIMRDGDDEDYQFMLTSESYLYSTDDGGDFWYLENDRMHGANEPGFPYLNRQGVYKFYASADGKKFLALSYKEGFWTKDHDAGWQWVATPDQVWLSAKPHPKRDAFAIEGKTKACFGDQYPGDCLQSLYYSPDWGTTVTDLVYANILQYAWSTLNDNFLFYTGWADPRAPSGDMYDTHLYRHDVSQGASSRKLLKEHQMGFLFHPKSQLLLVVSNTDKQSNQRRLFSSHDDGEHLKKCQFPEFLEEERTYNIMDTDAGSVFVMLKREGDVDRGDLYVSSDIGREFKLSLVQNVADGLQGDVKEIVAMEGTYIANVYEPPDDTVVTYITFDNGGYWQPIEPPVGSNECRNEPECYLNLLGRSKQNIGHSPYSTDNAIGLIISTGNVGKGLKAEAGQLNTYITRDGGVNWNLMATGNTHFAIADRGAIIVYAARDAATTQFQWSFNEGTSWVPCTWTSREVTSVWTSPTRDGSRFLVLSSLDGKNYVTKVDFGNLAAIQCKDPAHPGTAGSDYEYFNVASDGGCILGHKTTYVRKKREVKCFNNDVEIKHDVVNCPCAREDYECAPCFTEDFWENPETCIPIPGCTAEPKCADGAATYSQGDYRQLAGDTCTANAQDKWAPVEQSCAGVPTAPPTPPPTPYAGQPTPQPSAQAPTSAPSNKGPLIIAALVVAAIVVAVLIAIVLIRRSPAMAARFPGAPSWFFTVQQANGFESSFTTPGELEEPSEFDNHDFDF